MAGPPGVGKSHLAIGLAIKAAEAGHRVLFLTLEQLMGKLKRASQKNRLERQLQHLTYPKVLVLDEIGYLPLSREDASLLFSPGSAALREGVNGSDFQQELCGLG